MERMGKMKYATCEYCGLITRTDIRDCGCEMAIAEKHRREAPTCYHEARTSGGCIACDRNAQFMRDNWPSNATHANGKPYPITEALRICGQDALG